MYSDFPPAPKNFANTDSSTVRATPTGFKFRTWRSEIFNGTMKPLHCSFFYLAPQVSNPQMLHFPFLDERDYSFSAPVYQAIKISLQFPLPRSWAWADRDLSVVKLWDVYYSHRQCAGRPFIHSDRRTSL